MENKDIFVVIIPHLLGGKTILFEGCLLECKICANEWGWDALVLNKKHINISDYKS